MLRAEGGEPTTIGVVINPIAGYGARIAMHGTEDLDETQYRAAIARGRATDRMRRALDRLIGRLAEPPRLVAARGAMGGDLLEQLGLPYTSISRDGGERTTAEDTRAVARQLVVEGVDCVAFAGGDGTAADLAAAVEATPVVGVPAGVKMHSAAFARTPEAAGDLLAAVARGQVRAERRDLLDVVDARGPHVTGSVWVPASHRLLQPAKAARPVDDVGALTAFGHELAAADDSPATWILGPGTTVATVAAAMGLNSDVRGFTVAGPSGVEVVDATETQLLDAASRPGTRVLLGVIGGQGFLLGRGNHELSAEVLQLLDPARVHVVASAAKLTALQPPVLHVDLGDDRALPGLDGYRPVHVGPGRTMVMRIVSSVVPPALT